MTDLPSKGPNLWEKQARPWFINPPDEPSSDPPVWDEKGEAVTVRLDPKAYVRQTHRFCWEYIVAEPGDRVDSHRRADGWAMTQYGAYCKARRRLNALARQKRIASTEWKHVHSGSFR